MVEVIEVIKEKLEKEVSALRDVKQDMERLHAMLDEKTALAIETSGKIKAYRELLKSAEEDAAAAPRLRSAAGAEENKDKADNMDEVDKADEADNADEADKIKEGEDVR